MTIGLVDLTIACRKLLKESETRDEACAILRCNLDKIKALGAEEVFVRGNTDDLVGDYRSYSAELVPDGVRVLWFSGLRHIERVSRPFGDGSSPLVVMMPSANPDTELDMLNIGPEGTVLGRRVGPFSSGQVNTAFCGLGIVEDWRSSMVEGMDETTLLFDHFLQSGVSLRSIALESRAWIEPIRSVADIKRARFYQEMETSARIAREMMEPITGVLLDRDGVINSEGGHVRSIEQFKILPGVCDAVSRLTAQGIRCFVVTNQSGIARGYIDWHSLEKIHVFLSAEIEKAGGCLERFYVAPWHPDTALLGGCAAYQAASYDRKPQPGMLFRASRDSGIALANLLMVGDSINDKVAAESAGVSFMAVRSAKAESFPQAQVFHASLNKVATAIFDYNQALKAT